MSKLIEMSYSDLFKVAKSLDVDAMAEDLLTAPWPAVDVPAMAAGEFQVNCGKLRVMDASYPLDPELDGQGTHTLTNVKNGKWLAGAMTTHDASDMKRSQYWHHQRIDHLVTSHKERERDDDDAYYVMGNLSQVVTSYKQAASCAGVVHFLHIMHEDHNEPVHERLDGFELIPGYIEIERGIAGFFDLDWITSQHPLGRKEEDLFEHEGWKAYYRRMCDLTPETTLFGTAEHAAVAYGGNGGPYCYVKRDAAGQIVAARLVFVVPEYLRD
jgi:hypothetical protein